MMVQTEPKVNFGSTLIWLDMSDASALLYAYKLKGLILAQNERWRRGLGMQVEREAYF